MPKDTDKTSETYKPYFGLETLQPLEMFKDSAPSTSKQQADKTTAGTSVPTTPEDQQLPLSEALKEAAKIQEFRGDKTYDVTSFINEVELFANLFNGTNMEQYFFQRYVLKKIQGEAANVIRTINNPVWSQIKQELLKNFGIRESYHQLFHRALNVRNNNVRQSFTYLRNILDKLNNKYYQDSSKPIEFSPSVNEALILKTFLSNIPPHLSSIIYSRNIKNLRDAYYCLEECGLVKDTSKFENRQNNHNNIQNTNSKPNDTTQSTHNNTQNTNVNNNTNQNNTGRSSGQYRQNNSELSRQNRIPQYNTTTNHNQNNSTSRRTGSFQRTNQAWEPMEVDHLQENIETEESTANEVNFQLATPSLDYP